MQKKQWIWAIITSVISLTSCQDDAVPELTDQTNQTQATPSNCHQISKEDALNSLYDFMAEQSEGGLKSVGIIDTAEMWGVRCYSETNGNKSLQSDDGNLVYVVNFTEESGYAILAADDRISEEVLAVSGNGPLSKTATTAAVTQLSSDRIVLDEYPQTGDGFFTVPDYPDEIFMNPNTVSLYDEAEDDVLVGNFSTDDIGEEDENGNLVTSSNKALQAKAEEPNLGLNLCLDYAKRQVKAQRITKYDLEDESSSTTSIKKITTSWVDTGDNSNVLLSTYKSWHQHSPFNDQYPRRRKYIILGHRRKVPAGCFPLAIAKIMAKFSYPEYFYINGYRVNWSSLNSSYLTEEGRKAAATLLYDISVECKSKYFYQGTFTFPHRAIDFMESIGFKNVTKYDYKFSRVKEMIDKSKPVIVTAMPNFNVFRSHAWNIDGYKTKKRTITTNTYNGSSIVKSETKTEIREMVHCCFGWEGRGDGYYVSGIFDLRNADNEYDKNESSQNYDFDRFIKIITYDK